MTTADNIKPYVWIAQEIEIFKFLGEDLYERLEAGIEAGDLNADEKLLLNDYIEMPLVQFSMAHAMPFLPYEAGNGGIFKRVPDGLEATPESEVDNLVQIHNDLGVSFSQKMIDFLVKNKDKYPQYSTNDCDDAPTTDNRYKGGFFLG